LFTTIGVVVNLAFPAYYKYTNFVVGEVASLMGVDYTLDAIILPLAISFFTFQQIAYLVDTVRNKVGQHNLVEYLTFVTFFPQPIAGPIVHHSVVLTQFREVWKRDDYLPGVKHRLNRLSPLSTRRSRITSTYWPTPPMLQFRNDRTNRQ